MTGDPDMLIAEHDPVDEKPDAALIHQDATSEEAEIEPLADDCALSLTTSSMSSNEIVDEAMKNRILPKIDDLEPADESVFTWNLENYRSLRQKERSPNFSCGGHPW